MKLTIKLEGNEKLQFTIQLTSDRQDQPMGFVNDSSWGNLLNSTSDWRFSRWDMFFVDVGVSLSSVSDGLRVYVDVNGEQREFGRSETHLRLARFFVQPNLQDPAKIAVHPQPTGLDTDSHIRAMAEVEAWFLTRPEYQQMVEWGVSAMNKMREVLILAGKFDVEWWTEYQKNVDKITSK